MYSLNADLIPWIVAAAAAVAAVLTYVAGVRRGRRRARPAPQTAPEKTTGRAGRADRGDLLAAGIATAVAADGMWVTFADLGMPIPLRILTFVFLELAVVQSARRARRAMTENFSAGVDGIAMWVLTCVSAVLAASHEVMSDDPNAAVVLVRLVAPLVAAWGWERSMALERRLRGLRTSGITWRITPARVAVRLGLAEVGDRDVDQVDAHRRLVRVARTADRARTLRETGAAGWRQRRALQAAKRAMDEANEYAKLANAPELQAALLEQVGAIYNTSAFVEMQAAPWWWDAGAGAGAQPTPVARPVAQPDEGAVVALPERTRPAEEVRVRIPASADASAPSPAADAGAGASDTAPDAEPEVRTPDAAEAPAPVADIASAHLPHVQQAEETFAGDLAAGEVPSLRRIQSTLRVGQRRAQQVQAHLRSLAS